MLFAAGFAAPAEGAASDAVAPDWIAIGLVLSVVGAFLLGNAILLRHPRSLVESYFRRSAGAAGPRLGAIREYVFQRAQIAVGFTYLVGGFGIQLLGHYRAPAPSAPPATSSAEFPAAWVGAILVTTLVFLAGAWVWSRRSFRRHVRAHLRREPPDFATDLRLAREVGELFGVASEKDDTVQSYLERLHAALELPLPERHAPRQIPMPRLEEIEVEEA
jgi:hypothetical protein